MSKAAQTPPEGFQPIEVHPYVDENFEPIEVQIPNQAAPVAATPEPTTGKKGTPEP
jgi:hypothetical protein